MSKAVRRLLKWWDMSGMYDVWMYILRIALIVWTVAGVLVVMKLWGER